MNIAIAGGTGFVGTALVDELIKAHHTVFILTRHPEKYHNQNRVHYIGWLYEGARPENALNNLDVFINLAGESLNSGRWTAKRKQKITESRLIATKEMNRILAACTHKPSVVINASAIGVYGVSDQLTFSETTESIGEDFLAQTVKLWEHEALRSKAYSNRVILARFGLILDQQGGALPMMILPYKLMAGGTMGRGTQWLSWIHIQDVIRGILFCIDQPKISGPVNFTSPEPTQMKPFGQMISSITHRPHWLPVPSFALKLALGEMSMLVLEGQRVQPTKLLHYHFSFSYPTLKQALTDLLT
ncbi:TIGR01777 family oxidoreductase [Peribacillus asahii]|uniref:TIGR01777 family oxidoreductase n=1 Tax=Peribacillus asahii TaxID=228899 RepID=UPI00207A2BE2|nr:TIGR01777 family oxidoreductase [Peribacillus asahii]USK60498.1 TIGR01777 family oxidoreductase [Peribacillus asahii]